MQVRMKQQKYRLILLFMNATYESRLVVTMKITQKKDKDQWITHVTSINGVIENQTRSNSKSKYPGDSLSIEYCGISWIMISS